MSVVTWLALGFLVGAAAHMMVEGRLPGGLVGSMAAAGAGAFLGGAGFTVLAGGDTGHLDVASLLVAVVGACLLLLAVRKAARTELWTP